MQDRKMTNPTDGINESNKKLRQIYEQMCCISANIPPANYNFVNLVSLSSGDFFTIGANGAHSITWELGTGASLTIDNGSSAVTFTNSGTITFSTVNLHGIDFTAVGGTVRLMFLTID